MVADCKFIQMQLHDCSALQKGIWTMQQRFTRQKEILRSLIDMPFPAGKGSSSQALVLETRSLCAVRLAGAVCSADVWISGEVTAAADCHPSPAAVLPWSPTHPIWLWQASGEIKIRSGHSIGWGDANHWRIDTTRCQICIWFYRNASIFLLLDLEKTDFWRAEEAWILIYKASQDFKTTSRQSLRMLVDGFGPLFSCFACRSLQGCCTSWSKAVTRHWSSPRWLKCWMCWKPS